jgi:hypothetical protein
MSMDRFFASYAEVPKLVSRTDLFLIDYEDAAARWDVTGRRGVWCCGACWLASLQALPGPGTSLTGLTAATPSPLAHLFEVTDQHHGTLPLRWTNARQLVVAVGLLELLGLLGVLG